MEASTATAIDRYVDTHRDEIIADLDRLVRIPSVSVAGEDEAMPFGRQCALVLEEALAMAGEKGMAAKNYSNWYGIATRGEGAHTVGIFSHLDVVEVGDDWTYPPFQVTERDGWLFGRGVADDKIAAVMGMHTARALDELDLAHNLKLLLYFGVNEEKGMADLDRYLQEQEQPEFCLVPDFKFPGSIGETGVMKFELLTDRKCTSLTGFQGGEPGKRLPLEASVRYCGPGGDKLQALGAGGEEIAVTRENGVTRITAKGHPDTAWGAGDSVNALFALSSCLRESGALTAEDRALMGVIADMTGSRRGECFGIDRDGGIFGATKCTCLLAGEREGKLALSFDVRYPLEITGREIQQGVSDFARRNGFELADVRDIPPSLMDEADPRIQILCDAWTAVSGEEAKMGVGGGTYAKKLKNAVSYGPKDTKRCPFLPRGHGEIHCPDETRSVETLLNAVRVYIRAFVELSAYYTALGGNENGRHRA